ncbi:hypothetical protein [Mesorhizobium sp.]|uniref:hypothetical protein n=1 Tax=Mesorhizobium sp. TaxID=1871066 RepID=UPI0026008F24|nr:hypothetical protein [Mesorhizobium sp.]
MPATIAPASSRTKTASVFRPEAPTSLSLKAVKPSPTRARSCGKGSAVISSVIFMVAPVRFGSQP